MARAFIGLGSNIGDRFRNLKDAVNRIGKEPCTRILCASSIMETDPLEYTDQGPFFNMVIMIDTDFGPEKLLDFLLSVEEDMGRVRDVPKGPRIIDLDILLFDDICLRTEKLSVPHPGIKRRWFVMEHLIELDRDLVDPETLIPYREVYSHEDRKKYK